MQLKKFTLSFINTAKMFVICLCQCKVDELAQIERAQYHIILHQYKCCPLLKRFQILCDVYSNHYFRTKCLINSMHQCLTYQKILSLLSNDSSPSVILVSSTAADFSSAPSAEGLTISALCRN